MKKNYEDFIDSLTEKDMEEISNRASKELNERISVQGPTDSLLNITAKASFYISLYLLEKYHNWLNDEN